MYLRSEMIELSSTFFDSIVNYTNIKEINLEIVFHYVFAFSKQKIFKECVQNLVMHERNY